MKPRAVVPAALLATLLWPAGCGDGPTAPATIDALPRALSTAEEQVIASANAFGVDLLRAVAAEDDRPNLVLSPFSASMALGMTLNGAADGTFEAMREALRFGTMSQGEINGAYRDLVDLLTSLDPAVRLSIANATWADDGFPFHPAFFDSVSTYFDATAESSDFDDPATLAAINAWADEKTDGKIPRILDEIRRDQVMFLLNAVYFEGRWATRFDPSNTAPAGFHRDDGSQVTVDMMHLEDAELPFGRTQSGLAVVELPYGGKAWAMLVAVPYGPTPVRDVVAGLDQAGWQEMLDGLDVRDVDEVALPRFTLTYDAFLNRPLEAMGMGVAFTDAADFTNLSPRGLELCIDYVRQKTFIEVDEAGTRAAAVTAVGAAAESFTGLIADRPFLFAIRERLTGTILFAGIVGDPTAEDSGAAEEPLPKGCDPAS